MGIPTYILHSGILVHPSASTWDLSAAGFNLTVIPGSWNSLVFMIVNDCSVQLVDELVPSWAAEVSSQTMTSTFDLVIIDFTDEPIEGWLVRHRRCWDGQIWGV